MSNETAKPRSEFGYLRQRGKKKFWWVRYRKDGKDKWECLHTTDREKAVKELGKREDRRDRGVLLEPTARHVMYADLEALVLRRYRNEGNRSIKRAERGLKKLRPYFGDKRALEITSDMIEDYRSECLTTGGKRGKGEARASINYRLALLRLGFNEAIDKKRLPYGPKIRTPDPKNQRTGDLCNKADWQAVYSELADHLRAPMQFAYITGWRCPSEVLPLTWDRVDFEKGLVRLDPNTTKNGKGRTFPLIPELETLLREQRKRVDAKQRATGSIIPYVFPGRDGRSRIKSYYNGWKAAVRRAAHGAGKVRPLAVVVRPQVVGRIVHDFRRTAAKNLIDAGVSAKQTRLMVGWESLAMLDRYETRNEADQQAAGAKLSVYLSGTRVNPPKGARRGKIGVKSG